MIIKFEEKHGSRIVAGDTRGAIAMHVLKGRLNDGWYDGQPIADHANAAVARVDYAAAWRLIEARRLHEYEGFEIVHVEYA